MQERAAAEAKKNNTKPSTKPSTQFLIVQHKKIGEL